jgi:hypothetical protein
MTRCAAGGVATAGATAEEPTMQSDEQTVLGGRHFVAEDHPDRIS